MESTSEGVIQMDASVRDQEVDRYETVRQYSLAQILAVWAAATVPMGVLA
jgi:hypothetical protein